MRTLAKALCSIGLAAGVVSGCGTGGDRPTSVALGALNTPSPKASPTTATLPGPRCAHPTASLRPPAVMPKPGAMPPGSYMAHIHRRGYLIAGVDQNNLLFAYFNPLNRRIEGFEIDLVRALATAIFGDPNAVVLKAITPAERIPTAQGPSVDLVVDAMTITCARRKLIDFSTVYYEAGQKILVPSNSAVRSVKDLGGRPVCAAVGSTSLQTLEDQRPRPVPYPVNQRTDCLVALQEGSVDAITSDDSILLGFKAQDPYTKIVGARLAAEPYGMAISKAHPEFVRFVNGVLGQMRADGAWRTLYKRWLGRFSRIPAPPSPQYS